MADFGIRFFLCNIFICVITGIFLMIKRVLKNHLTSRMQFNLWFLLAGLLAVPFLPVRPIGLLQFFLKLGKWPGTEPAKAETALKAAGNMNISGVAKQIDDFTLSVSSGISSILGLILCVIWLTGVFAMLLFLIKSNKQLSLLKKSALPLQNKTIRILYGSCLKELKIKKNIPIYSTAFLKSPILAGLFRPCIYLPIHLISDFYDNDEGPKEMPDGCFHAAQIRYMLLHELQHYRHKDALAGSLMNLISVLYWFNPLVWYVLKEMKNDREIACDASVLKLLNKNDYEDYGNTLINFAEKTSLTPFPFTAGISGSMKQMQKRILHISSYQKPSFRKKLKGMAAFCVIAVIFLGLAPILSTYGADQNHYKWNVSPEQLSLMDLSAYFSEYEGSFVLYNLRDDIWHIYDMEHATLRTSPESTYKIYDALFGLEEGVIAPNDSFIAWNGVNYPFEAWNGEQDLYSAMPSSVNWYFQEIEERLGISAVRNYIQKIGYGNESIHPGVSSFWMQSSLKISPVEQVELLTDLYNNRFGFDPENINAVKDSICLFSSEDMAFYGKTGTGRIDDQDVNGWFVGFVETHDNTCFFAANIQNDTNADGSTAARITKSVLSELNIWK